MPSNRAEGPASALREATPGAAVIDASGGKFGLAALRHHRELLYFLTWRDIAIRYKQAALGVGAGAFQVTRCDPYRVGVDHFYPGFGNSVLSHEWSVLEREARS